MNGADDLGNNVNDVAMLAEGESDEDSIYDDAIEDANDDTESTQDSSNEDDDLGGAVRIVNVSRITSQRILSNLRRLLPSKSVEDRSIQFDRNLPATHAYLGSDLEAVASGIVVHDENSIVNNVPLTPLQHVVLMPGQQLPLNLLHPRFISQFRSIIEHRKLFGVISTAWNDVTNSVDFAKVGTLAQVLFQKEVDNDDDYSSIRVRAIGRQRFRLLERHSQLDGQLMGRIQILEEKVLPSIYRQFQSTNLKRVFGSDHRLLHTQSHSPHKVDQTFATVTSPIPVFVFQQFDVNRIISQIKTELRNWFDEPRLQALPMSEVEFSFWLLANLPFSDETKLKMLNLNCALQRLRYALQWIKLYDVFACLNCDCPVGSKNDIFCMSTEGILNAYVNPGGHIHETLTFYQVANFKLAPDAPCSEYSWFPGYAWTIMSCNNCKHHIGWKFTCTDRKLKPKLFYGITRASIKPSCNKDENEIAELLHM